MAKLKNKISKVFFLYVLAVVSMIGFLVIFLKSTFSVDILPFQEGILLMVLGVGLAVEGRIRSIFRMHKNGFTKDEISHISASVVGMMAFVVGFISLPFIAYTNPTFEGIKGIVSGIAIVVIFVEAFLIK